MHLTNFDIEEFLRDVWQKKPLVIRGGISPWTNPIAPDGLAGLACEEDVESRLIIQNTDRWNVEHGPFAEKRFGDLGAAPWTLLVQAADHFVPAIAALIEPFRFIPNWRIDDVMVSYAADQGGVGPHFDQYDVFLIQGLGQRRWQVGAMCDEASELLAHGDLRLLANFDATDEWILEPGDILYVPPGIAHNGTAIGDDCMTYSVGFRAPARSELIGHWCDDLLEGMEDDDRYRDPSLQRQANPGELTQAAITNLHAMVTEKMADRAAFARWFGQYTTTVKYPEIDWRPENPIGVKELRAVLRDTDILSRNPASCFSYIRQDGDCVLLFVDGECFDCAGPLAVLAQLLCGQSCVTIRPEMSGSDDVLGLLVKLLNKGCLMIGQDD